MISGETIEIIKEWVDYRGMTQKEFANRLGVDRMTVYRWFNGVTSPSLNDIYKMMEVLGIEQLTIR